MKAADSHKIDAYEEIKLTEMSKRKIYCIEFFKAVNVFAEYYGRDMLNHLLDEDRIVRLTHEEIVELAAAIKSKPHEFTDIGDIIRAGDTGMIRYYLYQRQYCQ